MTSEETVRVSSSPSSEAAPPAPKPMTRRQRQERWFEVAAGIILAVVAVATAWSGYQAARWDGVQAERYSQAAATRVESTRAATLAGQHTLYDLNLFNQWLNAYEADTADLAALYEKRFRPEFRPAFEAWLATDPFNNPDAPPGPLYMPEYVIKEAEEARALEAEAAQLAAQGDQSQANALLIQATRTTTEAGQHTLYDLTMFNQWLNARATETADLTALYERRFRPEFWYAFEAWLATDPFNNPDAPPGPLYMPEYSVSEGEEARRLDVEAARLAAEGETANEVSDKYVLNTVFLAACLFFIAIGERFEWVPVRIAILVMAALMLVYGVYHLIIYPIQ